MRRRRRRRRRRSREGEEEGRGGCHRCLGPLSIGRRESAVS